MSNYYGTGRSSYFLPKNLEKLKQIAKIYDLIVLGPDNTGKIALMADQSSGEPESNIYFDEDKTLAMLIELGLVEKQDDEDIEEIEIPGLSDIIHEYLAPGEIFIWTHVGNEAAKYLIGYTYAINEHGDIINLNLEDITDMIKKKWMVML